MLLLYTYTTHYITVIHLYHTLCYCYTLIPHTMLLLYTYTTHYVTVIHLYHTLYYCYTLIPHTMLLLYTYTTHYVTVIHLYHTLCYCYTLIPHTILLLYTYTTHYVTVIHLYHTLCYCYTLIPHTILLLYTYTTHYVTFIHLYHTLYYCYTLIPHTMSLSPTVGGNMLVILYHTLYTIYVLSDYTLYTLLLYLLSDCYTLILSPYRRPPEVTWRSSNTTHYVTVIHLYHTLCYCYTLIPLTIHVIIIHFLPLQAAARGNMEVIHYLLDKGAKVKVKDTSGLTPVDEATFNEHTEVVTLLTSYMTS